MYVCIYIYMHAVKFLSGPSLANSGVIICIWAKFVFTLCVKNTIRIGVLADLVGQKKSRTKISGVAIWAKLAIFVLQQTWPR